MPTYALYDVLHLGMSVERMTDFYRLAYLRDPDAHQIEIARMTK